MGPDDPGSNPGNPIWLSKQKMTSKLKKTGAAGRFGARYGKRAKDKLSELEKKQRIKQKCPYCGKKGAKRLSKGIWKCFKCENKFASDTYFLGE